MTIRELMADLWYQSGAKELVTPPKGRINGEDVKAAKEELLEAFAEFGPALFLEHIISEVYHSFYGIEPPYSDDVEGNWQKLLELERFAGRTPVESLIEMIRIYTLNGRKLNQLVVDPEEPPTIVKNLLSELNDNS